MSANPLPATAPLDKPKAIPPRPNLFPDELKVLNQWVNWKHQGDKGRKDWAKPPINPRTGSNASPTKPDTWGTFEEAKNRYYHKNNGEIEGLGFVVCRSNGIVVVDLDGCRNPRTKHIEPWAADIIRDFNSYTSVSPSKTGIRIFAYGTMIKPALTKKMPGGGQRKVGLEVYVDNHYLTETGLRIPGTPRALNNAQVALDALIGEHWPNGKGEEPASRPRTTSIPSGMRLDDDTIIDKMKASKHGNHIRRLMDGDTSNHNNDDSAADQALCWNVAFYTRDADQIDRIFRRSKLNRDKWEKRPDYRDRTIGKALDHQTGRYSGSRETRPYLHVVTSDDVASQEVDAESRFTNLNRRRNDEHKLLHDSRILDSDCRTCLLIWERTSSYPSDPDLDEQPFTVFWLDEVARELGIQRPAASKRIKRLVELGLIVRDTSLIGDGDSRWRIKAGTFPAKELSEDDLRTSDRKKDAARYRERCPHCGGVNIHPLRFVCEDCGATSSAADTFKASVDYETDEKHEWTEMKEGISESETIEYRHGGEHTVSIFYSSH